MTKKGIIIHFKEERRKKEKLVRTQKEKEFQRKLQQEKVEV